MNIAVVDGRPEDLAETSETLKAYAGRNSLCFDLSTFPDGASLLENYRPNRFRIIFLDIFMNGLSGIETARRIRELDEDVSIVFLTVSDEHQSEAIHLHVYDYLNKEDGRDAIFGMLDRFFRKRADTEQKRIDFTVNRQPVRLPYNDLVYAAADRNYLVLHDRKGTEYRTRMTFSALQARLEADSRFLQILRGVIVNMDYITDVSKNVCCLQGSIHLPVSIRNRERIEQIWNNYTFAGIRRESMTEEQGI